MYHESRTQYMAARICYLMIPWEQVDGELEWCSHGAFSTSRERPRSCSRSIAQPMFDVRQGTNPLLNYRTYLSLRTLLAKLSISIAALPEG